MAGCFSLKSIRITVALGKGTFSDEGNIKVIEGLPCDVEITKPGLPEQNSAKVKIWGLRYDDLAQLTMLSFRPLESQHNTMTIEAGEQGQSLSMIYQGEITSASADFNQIPDPCMEFDVATSVYPGQFSPPDLTTNGEASVVDLFSRFAADAGYSYQNEGVAGSVMNACFPGSPIRKMEKLARDVGCGLIIDDGVVITVPEGKTRGGGPVVLGMDTGLLGHPTFTQNGISLRSLFNPNLRQGGLVQVKSIVPKASGTWQITRLSHSLSAYNAKGGAWESRIEASPHE